MGRLDVFHFSDWMYPAQRSGVRATTVYDLSPLHHPEWVAPLTARMHGRKYAEAARSCDVFFAISSYTAQDVDRDARPAAPSASRSRYRACTRASRRRASAADLGAPYVLSVATLEPRKNLSTLVQAFALVRARRPDLQLVVAGAPVAWAEQDLAAEGVRALGFVPDSDLPALYRGAAASRLSLAARGLRDAGRRGDGLRHAGRRVLAPVAGRRLRRGRSSRRPAQPRGARRRRSSARMTERERLVPLGLEHARRFTWKACGEALLAGYDRAGA